MLQCVPAVACSSVYKTNKAGDLVRIIVQILQHDSFRHLMEVNNGKLYAGLLVMIRPRIGVSHTIDILWYHFFPIYLYQVCSDTIIKS